MSSTDPLPRHVALIPDGNRRWARKHGLPDFEGHRRGAQVMKDIVKTARDLTIQCVTTWGLSTENWNRDKKELNFLMTLFATFLEDVFKESVKTETRVTHLGRKDRLTQTLVERLTYIEAQTKHFSTYYLNIALDYGGRDEIVRAIHTYTSGSAPRSEVSESTYGSYLDTRELPYPDPDLVIRTGGEMRLSGFMPWQTTYSELIFVPDLLPDFTPEMFRKCISEYMARQRRFGK